MASKGSSTEGLQFGGAPRVMSHDFYGETQMSDFYWLYLAMSLLKTLFCELKLSPG
jgi:hypothetical protein